jgi:Fe-S-cluster containining protein
MSKDDVIHFYEARGAEVTRSDDELFIVFNIPCPHLSLKGCGIYKDRPKICRKYSGLHEFGDDCLWSTIPKTKTSAVHKKAGAGKTKSQKK